MKDIGTVSNELRMRACMAGGGWGIGRGGGGLLALQDPSPRPQLLYIKIKIIYKNIYVFSPFGGRLI